MRVKKIFTILLLISALVISSVVTISAAPTQKIKVAFPYVFGFSETDSDGKHSGYIYDYLEEIAKYTGWEYEYIDCTPFEALTMFQEGKVDLMGGVAYNEEVAKYALFPEYNNGHVDSVLNVSASNTEIGDIEYTNLHDYTIGICRDGNRLTTQFENFVKANDVSYKSKMYDTFDELYDALANGDVDIILTNSVNVDLKNQRTIARFASTPHYIVTPTGNHEILNNLNKSLQNVKSVDPTFSTKLTQKYFSTGEAELLVLNQQEREYIAQKNVHSVVANPNGRPIQYFDDTGELKGISADILGYIAKETGLIFSYLPTKTIEETTSHIKNGRADVIVGVINKDSTLDQYDTVTSASYLTLNIGMIKNKNSEANASSKVAISKPLRYLVNDLNVDITTYDTVEECIEAVNTGKADYTYSNSYIAEYLTQKYRYANTAFIPTVQQDNSLSFGLVRPVDPALLTIINKTISNMPASTIQSIILNNTLQMDREITLSSFIQSNPVASIAILGAFFLVLSVLIILIFINKANSNKKMYSMVNVDEVTGAMTFSRFKTLAAETILNSAGQYALVSFDINKFKIINDLFGHKSGDEILQFISATLEENLAHKEIFTRINADNFNILLEYRSDGGVISRISAMQKTISGCLEGYHIDASFGIYRIAKGETDEIVTMSDSANLAKLSIKDKPNVFYAFFDEAVRSNILREKEIENQMEEALYNKEFKLYLQPKYSFTDGQIVGAEALVRWDNREKGMIYPNDFIPLFEKNGFIQKLDTYMFEQVCRFLCDLDVTVIPTISVNFSRVHLNNLNLANELVTTAKKVGVAPENIEVELTETAIFDNEDRMIRVMTDLKNAGFSLSIDDFGSGYSSLSALKNLPADVIKFDRGFLLESTDNQRGKDIIKYLVHMSRSLNLTTVAEGVETQQQVDFLKEVGCDIAQGYYYAKPMPAEEFVKIYKLQIAAN